MQPRGGCSSKPSPARRRERPRPTRLGLLESSAAPRDPGGRDVARRPDADRDGVGARVGAEPRSRRFVAVSPSSSDASTSPVTRGATLWGRDHPEPARRTSAGRDRPRPGTGVVGARRPVPLRLTRPSCPAEEHLRAHDRVRRRGAIMRPSCHLLVAGRVDDRSYARSSSSDASATRPWRTCISVITRARRPLLAAADAFVLDSFLRGRSPSSPWRRWSPASRW